MFRLHAMFRRVFGLFQKKTHEAEMAEEMRAHLDGLTERNVAAGMSPEEARYAALRTFGGMAQLQEQCRDQRRSPWIENLLRDLRFGARTLRKNPGFTLVAVLILGLGIGVNTAVFTAIDNLLGRTLHFAEPEQLVLVTNVRPSGVLDTLSYPVYERFRDHAQSLSGIFAFGQNNSGRSLVPSGLGQNDAVAVQCLEVSGNFFSLLGISASSGRTLTPEDDRKGDPRPVAVLSYAFWQRQFGGDRDVLDKTILLDKVSFQIVGIAPRGFWGVDTTKQPVDLWVPIQMRPILDPTRNDLQPGRNIFVMMGRLHSGVKRQTASAELDVIFQQWLVEVGYPALNRMNIGKIDLQPGGAGRVDRHRGETLASAAILMVLVGLVLVIACANVTSLLLARLTVRQRELAVRAAMGAGRSRLIRQLWTESLLLAAAGSVSGVLVLWGTNAVIRHFDMGFAIDLRPNGSVLLFTILVSIGTGVFVGFLPAIRFSRIDLVSALKDQTNSATGGSRQRLNRALVVLQLAVSVCLLAGTGLFVRTLQNLKNVNLGFDRENLLVLMLSDKNHDANRQVNLVKDALPALEALPGVRSGTVAMGGLWSRPVGTVISVDGYQQQRSEDMSANIILSGPRIFETMGVPLVRGRGLNFADVFQTSAQMSQNTTGAAVINEAMARRFFGNADPIGHRIMVWSGKYEIIGVARNTKYASLRENSSLEIYVPYFDSRSEALGMLIRTTGDPSALVSSVSAAIERIDPKVRVMSAYTMKDAVDRAVAPERLIARIAGGFSLFALLLACLGLYGLLAYNVAQRTREIGVRMALGADARDVQSLVVKQGVGFALMGCAIGSAAAMALAHIITSKLYGVTAADPLTFLGTALLLLLVTLLACWLPSRRATKVDPMIALRAE